MPPCSKRVFSELDLSQEWQVKKYWGLQGWKERTIITERFFGYFKNDKKKGEWKYFYNNGKLFIGS